LSAVTLTSEFPAVTPRASSLTVTGFRRLRPSLTAGRRNRDRARLAGAEVERQVKEHPLHGSIWPAVHTRVASGSALPRLVRRESVRILPHRARRPRHALMNRLRRHRQMKRG
jgi:hypothetical protein